MLLYPLYYDTMSLTSLKIIQEFHLLLSFVENNIFYLDFKNQDSVQITEGLGIGDSYN